VEEAEDIPIAPVAIVATKEEEQEEVELHDKESRN